MILLIGMLIYFTICHLILTYLVNWNINTDIKDIIVFFTIPYIIIVLIVAIIFCYFEEKHGS